MNLFAGWQRAAAALLVLGSSSLVAAPALRVSVDQHGDFALIGNTLGQECAAGTPLPSTGTVGSCGVNIADSAPDVYWRADSPALGVAEANNTITAAQARSTAVLSLPPGAQVTHAYLYWSATALAPSTNATIERVGAGGFAQPVTSLQLLTGPNNTYRNVADVTALVQANGSGAYRLSGVSIDNWVDVANSNAYAGWWMVVLYRLDSDPLRSLALFDGLDAVANGIPQSVSIGGFVVPTSFGTVKLAAVAMEGDNTGTGDGLSYDGLPISDLLNPPNNVFNSTHSYLGSAVSVAGDLPRTTGDMQSMSGIDLDVFDVTALVQAGDTSATITATSASDVYHLTTLVASVPTLAPLFGTSSMSVTDLDGGVPMPGDELLYSVSVANSGSDTAAQSVFTDPIPGGTAYVPGSLEILAGANAGPKSDAVGDDQAEFDAGNNRILMRLGTGADGTTGGNLAPNDSTVLRFKVVVSDFCSGTLPVVNVATLNAVGLGSGLPLTSDVDGDAGTPGTQPSTTIVDVRCLTLGTSGAGSGSISVVPNGVSCSSGSCSQPMPANSLIALDALPDANSTFNGWSGDAGGATTPVAVTLDVDRSVGALFRANQAITNFASSPVSPVFNFGATFDVSADGGGSGQPVVFASVTPGVCQLLGGGTMIIISAGPCSITADQAGDANYNAAPQVQLDVTVARAPQAIGDFTASPAAPVFVPGGTFTVSAIGGGSGQPLVFGSLTPATCSVAGTTATMLAAGLCTVSANQAGDGNYEPAPQATLDVTIAIDDTIFRNGFDGA